MCTRALAPTHTCCIYQSRSFTLISTDFFYKRWILILKLLANSKEVLETTLMASILCPQGTHKSTWIWNRKWAKWMLTPYHSCLITRKTVPAFIEYLLYTEYVSGSSGKVGIRRHGCYVTLGYYIICKESKNQKLKEKQPQTQVPFMTLSGIFLVAALMTLHRSSTKDWACRPSHKSSESLKLTAPLEYCTPLNFQTPWMSSRVTSIGPLLESKIKNPIVSSFGRYLSLNAPEEA